jgi:hypothetical protein
MTDTQEGTCTERVWERESARTTPEIHTVTSCRTSHFMSFGERQSNEKSVPILQFLLVRLIIFVGNAVMVVQDSWSFPLCESCLLTIATERLQGDGSNSLPHCSQHRQQNCCSLQMLYTYTLHTSFLHCALRWVSNNSTFSIHYGVFTIGPCEIISGPVTIPTEEMIQDMDRPFS